MKTTNTLPPALLPPLIYLHAPLCLTVWVLVEHGSSDTFHIVLCCVCSHIHLCEWLHPCVHCCVLEKAYAHMCAHASSLSSAVIIVWFVGAVKVAVITFSLNAHMLGNIQHTPYPMCSCLVFISGLLFPTSTRAGVVLCSSSRGNGWTASLITLHPLTLIYIQTLSQSSPNLHYLWIPFCRPWYFGCYSSFKLCFSPLLLGLCTQQERQMRTFQVRIWHNKTYKFHKLRILMGISKVAYLHYSLLMICAVACKSLGTQSYDALWTGYNYKFISKIHKLKHQVW